MPIRDLDEFQPPREIAALGTPQRVFARSRDGSERIAVAFRAFGFLLVALSTVVFGLFFTTASPETRTNPSALTVIGLLGGFFFVAGAALILIPQKPWPGYVYAAYPHAFAYLHDGTWSSVSWAEVEQYR